MFITTKHQCTFLCTGTKICNINCDGKLELGNKHGTETSPIIGKGQIAIYFLTLDESITQPLERRPSSNRLVIIISYSASKLSNNSEVMRPASAGC
jgi:hypothetical protein